MFKTINSTLQFILAIIILATSALIYIPFAPTFPYKPDALDGGWIFALNQAVAQHLVFGKNLIFTFGPYASLYTHEYSPQTAFLMFSGSFFVALAFGFSLLYLSRKSIFSKLIAACTAFSMFLMPSDTRFMGLSFLALLLICQIATDPEPKDGSYFFKTISVFLMTLALGWFPLVKATFGVCAFIVIFIACLLSLEKRKFIIAFSIIGLFLSWVAFLWVAAGQPILDLPGFFIAQLPIVSGYTAAMSTPSPWFQLLFFVVFCALVWFFGNQKLHIENSSQLALAIGSALILFMAFKEGLVRDDLHRLTAGGMLAVAGGSFFLAYRTKPTLIACIIGVIGFLIFNFPHFSLQELSLDAKEIVAVIKTPHKYQLQYNASLQDIRSSQPLPLLSGPTDIYSWGQSALLGNGLDWDPRPVLQSYSAYTPTLEEKNKRHLIGPKAPQNIFFEIQPIDNRLPSLEDGASWPLLLANYQFKGLYNNGTLALLERRENPTLITTSQIFSGTFKPNTQIKVPNNVSFAWAELVIKPTLLGRVAGIFFKPPQIHILYTFPDGHSEEFRYIAGMGETGFLLSPLVESTRDFLELSAPEASTYFANRRPVSVSIVMGQQADLFWMSHFSLKISEIKFISNP